VLPERIAQEAEMPEGDQNSIVRRLPISWAIALTAAALVMAFAMLVPAGD
jgi:hypothetical protein